MRVLTENEIRNLTPRIESGGKFSVPSGTLLTPLARDYLRSRGIDIVDTSRNSSVSSNLESSASGRYDRTTIRPENTAGTGEEDVLVDAVASEVTRLLREREAQSQSTPQSADAVLPERNVGSESRGSAHRAVVWAIGGDRPGILAAVAELLGRRNANILEINQTILSGVFAMVVIVDLTHALGAFGEFKTDLEALGKTLGITLSAQRDEIFQYMHRIT